MRAEHVVEGVLLHCVAVALPLVVLGVEVAADDEVGVRVGRENLVDPGAQHPGVAPAGRLGRGVGGAGFPVIAEQVQRRAVDRDLNFDDLAGVGRRV